MSQDDFTIYQLEKDDETIQKTILTTIIKMLTARKILKEESLESNIKKIIETESDDLIYTVKISDTENFAIKLLLQKITAINKTSSIYAFLNTFKDEPKIIVVKEISKKALQFINLNYKNTEVFNENELLINIIDHDLVPIHEILTKEETEEFLEKYNVKKRNLPKILKTDPVARYYNMQIGDICRILRPSEQTSFAPTYRLVVQGN